MKGGPSREAADEWLQRYPDDATVMAYIGRSGWNDLAFGGAIPDDELLEAVDESYRLVVAKLPKKHRPEGWDALGASHGPRVRRAGVKTDQAGDHQRDVEDAGDHLDHHQRPGVVAARASRRRGRRW